LREGGRGWQEGGIEGREKGRSRRRRGVRVERQRG
jgi:hypothetical protein